MSETVTSHPVMDSPDPVQSPALVVPPIQRPARPAIKLFVPGLVLFLFWTLTEASFRLEMGMFYRFVTRMVLLLALAIYFLWWGFTRKHFTFAQRWLAFAMIMSCLGIAGVLGHPSTGIGATAMLGMPIVFSLSIAWLWLVRHRSARLELTGIALSSVVVFGTLALLRWDGLDGRQRAEMSWRWTPNPEERFRSQETAQSAAKTETIEPQRLVATAADWVSFRGGDRENVVNDVQFGDWSNSPPKEVWRRRVGPGWSSVIEVGDYLFTQEQRGTREAVICYDSQTGQEVWVHSPEGVDERFDDSLSGTGPRATPTFHDGRLYTYGAKGRLECLDAVTGQSQWSHALFAMTNVGVPMWGASTSPAIVDDMVVVYTGGQNGNSLIAFNRLTGEQRWQAGGGPISYSSPQVMTIAGERQIVMHDDEGLQGVQIQDGKRLWKHTSPHGGSFQPMLQPHLIAGDRLIVNWDSGILCLQVHKDGENWQLEELWKSNRIKPSFNDFVIHQDYIYGLDDGILCCVDLVKGQRTWKKGRYGFGQLLLLPQANELLVLTERGELVRVSANPTEHRELGQFKAIEGKTWNHFLLARDRLIVRNSEEMACFEVDAPVVTADNR